MDRNRLARGFLIAGLAFVFGYFGIDKFIHPLVWIGWMPPWMDGLLGFSKDVWLQITGALEIFFSLLLIIPVRRMQQTGAILVALHLVAVLTQTGWNDIAIRDIGLMLSSLALLLMLSPLSVTSASVECVEFFQVLRRDAKR